LTASVTLLRPFPPSRILRGMARDRHIEAVEALCRGDRDLWWSMLKDVATLERQERLAREWEETCRVAYEGASAVLEHAHRRLRAEALAELLELAGTAP
jgi:hypothetical protein